MWITEHPITGEKIELEDISHCFMLFPLFHFDFNILFSEGIIKRTDLDLYEWTKSKTSLAEYFKWIGKKECDIPGGFWAPIEKVFKINRRMLSKLASGNGNGSKPDESKDFIKIKGLVVQYREEIRQKEEEAKRLNEEQAKLQKNFKAINKLIEKAEHGDIEMLRATKEKIKEILS